MLVNVQTTADALSFLQHIPQGTRLLLVFRRERARLVTKVTRLHGFDIQFEDQNTIPFLDAVAESGHWHEVHRAHVVLLLSQNPVDLKFLASQLAEVIEAVEDLSRIEGLSEMGLLAFNPALCYDAKCFEQTCHALSCAGSVEQWLAKYDHEAMKELPVHQIIKRMVPPSDWPTHGRFLQEYVGHFDAMVGA